MTDSAAVRRSPHAIGPSQKTEESDSDARDSTSAPTVCAALREAATRSPDAPAIRVGDQVVTHGGLHAAASRFAVRLRAAGASRGDRIVIAWGDPIGWTIGYFGVLLSGAVAVPLQPTSGRPVRGRLRDCAPALLVAGPDLSPAFRSAAAAVGVPVLDVDASLWTVPSDTPDVFASCAPEPDALAVLVYALFDDGQPAVELTHANLAAAAGAAVAALGLGADDVLLSCLPLASIAGQTLGLNAATVAGACLAFPGAPQADVLLDTIREQRATVLGTYSALLPALGRSVQSRADAAVPALRTVLATGGGGVPARLRTTLEAGLGCEVLESFGPAQSSGLACATPSGARGRSSSVGLPVDGVEVRVADRSLREVRPGLVGRLLVRGALAASGYWRDPDATEDACRDGWIYTGCTARIDEDGYCYLADAGWAGMLNGSRPGGGAVRRLLKRFRSG